MTPSNDAATTQSSPSPITGLPSLKLSKVRAMDDNQSLASSVSSLPYRPSNASVSTLFASTSSLPGSRSASPGGGPSSSKLLASSVFLSGTPTIESPSTAQGTQAEDPRNLLTQAYIPHIAVHTSDDVQELARDKGFTSGLWEMLRPFGEQVQGKVTVRDSIGASKTWDDFAVRFVQLGDGLETDQGLARKGQEGQSQRVSHDGSAVPSLIRTGGNITHIEKLVDCHLSYAETVSRGDPEDYLNYRSDTGRSLTAASPFHTLYLRRLLSGIPLAPHETFSHPVACIIAISSRSPNPIESLRRLYDESTRGDKRLPVWVHGEYLRYYVLIHDEERDDIGKSMALFEQMKRHFGLHCHLLRLRSTQCVPTDDDSIALPTCEWVSASEELARIEALDAEEHVEDTTLCLFDSDVTALRTFIREMVTQSVLPSMERCVSTWNDQVASRRRGISGRFISLSKRWTGFGGGSRNSTMSSGPGSGANSNYDFSLGYYKPDAPEAIMRKLADYAFMLRDWKLALSTYDLLRSDFSNDKAWKYHAAANEMAAISTLLTSQTLSSKVRAETVDQMLETASYSYITRCGYTYGALRCLALGTELLRIRGGSATDDAARWATRIIESQVTGNIGDALFRERIAACYASRRGVGSGFWGRRTRKAALWNVLAAEKWLEQDKKAQALQRLDDISGVYDALQPQENTLRFGEANAFLERLRRDAQPSVVYGSGDNAEILSTEEESLVEEESEALDNRKNRKSLIGAPLNFETSSISPGGVEPGETITTDEGFQ